MPYVTPSTLCVQMSGNTYKYKNYRIFLLEKKAIRIITKNIHKKENNILNYKIQTIYIKKLTF